MKILITEDQLDKVIYKYIEKECKNSTFYDNNFYFNWKIDNRSFLEYNKKDKLFEIKTWFWVWILELFSSKGSDNHNNYNRIEKLTKKWGENQLKKMNKE